MPRCPDHLNPDDFDKLAASLGIELSDTGVSALSELAEYLSLQMLYMVIRNRDANSKEKISDAEIVEVATSLGIAIEPGDGVNKTLASASIGNGQIQSYNNNFLFTKKAG
jgi:hypothetical protein